MNKRYTSLRWLLLGAGIIAIIGLTAMNVYSLYQLHESTIEADRQPKKLRIKEFTDRVRYRFYKPFWGLSATNMDWLKARFEKESQFTYEVGKRVYKAATDSLYDNVYFVTPEMDPCRKHEPILRYSSVKKKLIEANEYPESICSGMAKARSGMQSIVDYSGYTNKTFFDADKSVTIVFIDPSNESIFGYLVIVLNRDYLIQQYLPENLQERFGKGQHSGMQIWIRDWTTDTIIASSHPNMSYNSNNIQFKQSFPNFFDNWNIEVAFTNTPTVKASNTSLIRNLFLLGGAFLILIGALVFMFTSAQKERKLAKRQANFLANVTHELKTPLSVMQAAGENLSDGRVSDQERIKSYGTHIFDEAVRLRTMIEKLLDVAKSDAGESMINPRPLNVSNAVKKYIQEHQKYIKRKGFQLETQISDHSLIGMIDPNSFGTILSNLVKNAIKYSGEEKYVGIFLKKEGQRICLRVVDHGIGMSKEVQSNIFEKFYRAEGTLTAKTKGHGLGLSIVKSLVDLNEGNISVDSSVKLGSTFKVSFPILSASQETGTEQTQHSSENVQSASLTS